MAFEDSQDANMTARSQDYWALDDVSCCSELKLQEGLKKRGIIYNQTSHSLRGKPLEVNSRLAKLHSRSERGLLLYEDIATSELRKFVAARGLEPDVNYARKNKKYLEALLERADEEATFPHFEVCLILINLRTARMLNSFRSFPSSCASSFTDTTLRPWKPKSPTSLSFHRWSMHHGCFDQRASPFSTTSAHSTTIKDSTVSTSYASLPLKKTTLRAFATSRSAYLHRPSDLDTISPSSTYR